MSGARSDVDDLLQHPLPIMIKMWAGEHGHDYRYISRSLRSLRASQLPASARIILIDDLSTDARAPRLAESYARSDSRIELWRNPERMGPNRGHEYNFPRVVARYPDAKLFAMCDDDIIYHPGWLQRLAAVYLEARAHGVSGILSALNVPARPHYGQLDLPTSRVLLKERQMALNWVVPREVYETVGPFRDTGVAYDTDYTDRTIAQELPIICLQPSYVQNIGYFGAYQNSDALRALDYVGQRDAYLYLRDLGFGVRHVAMRVRESAVGDRIWSVMRPLVRAFTGSRR